MASIYCFLLPVFFSDTNDTCVFARPSIWGRSGIGFGNQSREKLVCLLSHRCFTFRSTILLRLCLYFVIRTEIELVDWKVVENKVVGNNQSSNDAITSSQEDDGNFPITCLRHGTCCAVREWRKEKLVKEQSASTRSKERKWISLNCFRLFWNFVWPGYYGLFWVCRSI